VTPEAPSSNTPCEARFQARLEPQGWVFDAPAHLTLMKAARRAGFDMPRSCQNGTCRACMCHMVSGQVRYRVEWPGLTPDERQEGIVLPCVALPMADVVLRVPGATLRPMDPQELA
jgi:ferredoxin